MIVVIDGQPRELRPGDSIGLSAEEWDAAVQQHNGYRGPCTFLQLESRTVMAKGLMPVPEKEPPSTRIENARAEVRCYRCSGTGYDDVNGTVFCPACGGSGKEG